MQASLKIPAFTKGSLHATIPNHLAYVRIHVE